MKKTILLVMTGVAMCLGVSAQSPDVTVGGTTTGVVSEVSTDTLNKTPASQKRVLPLPGNAKSAIVEPKQEVTPNTGPAKKEDE